MSNEKHIDEVTGVETTGHVWDGDLMELNKPLPKWWLYVLYASIVWSIGYWIVYPAWPTLAGFTKGTAGYSQRQTVADAIADAKAQQKSYRDAILAKSYDEIMKDKTLLDFARAGGAAAFGANCAGCHGRGAQGSTGYPNLNDDDWLWGGSMESLSTTINYGIRSGHEKAHDMAMPRFGLDQLLETKAISDVANHVLSLSRADHDKDAAARGAPIYAEQCASCHGETGKGNPAMGAPNLADPIWLYGSRPEDVIESIKTGRGGRMPAWHDRLEPVTLKMLTLYVHTLGGGN